MPLTRRRFVEALGAAAATSCVALTALRSMVTLVTPGLYTGIFALFVGPLVGAGLPGAPYLLAAILMAATAVLVMRSASTLRATAGASAS